MTPRALYQDPHSNKGSPQADRVAATRILYVDDEIDTALVRLLEIEGFRVEIASTGSGALARAVEHRFDAIILDLHLPDMFGLTVLARLAASRIHSPVLVITGCYGEEEMERQALQAGADAFRRKPLLSDEIAATLRDIIARRGQTVATWRSAVDDAPGFVAVSPTTRRLADWIARVGPSAVAVLITGESGVGKELAAHAIHHTSSRRGGPFVPVNCGAIPDGLFESELFGHAKGSFTGAVADKLGLLEVAHTGSLFLDEIAELPALMQVRLLRALDDGEIRRVGETRTRHVDARIIAATNRSIQDEIQCGRFRKDLYFRVAVATYHIPPLRERPDEIEPLARYWLKRLSTREGGRGVDISQAGLTLLRGYQWPGNVRELRNVLEHILVWATGPVLTEHDISSALSAVIGGAPTATEHAPEDIQQSLAALEAHHWNRTAAARSLGIDRTTLWRRLKRLKAHQRRDG
jgi:DNA-binding NtrC family response regulator